MATFYKLIRPMAMMLPPEAAHGLSLAVLKAFYAFPRGAVDDPILKTACLGLSFKTPIGIAAGYDKDAKVPAGLFNAGFSFVEVGTLTPKAQPGNSRPRIFRLKEDRAVINRLGFNNKGFDSALVRIKPLTVKKKYGPLGVNIGANKDSADRIGDYVLGLRTFFEAVDYFTINVSSPNTPGLRDLQGKKNVNALLAKLAAEKSKLSKKTGGKSPPLLLKIAPDLDGTALREIVSAAVKHSIDGLIISNTTTSRPETLKSKYKGQDGGLSGQPLFDLSTVRLEEAWRISKGKLALIGVGGVATPRQAYEKILKGASLIQLYTGMIYEGPGLPGRLAEGLAELLRHDGFTSVSQAVGKGVK